MPRFNPCTKCSRYGKSLKRCIDGKVNPPTLAGTKDVLRIFGFGMVCWKNGLRFKAARILSNEIDVRTLAYPINPGA